MTWAPVSPRVLDIDATLTSGQAFRWRRGTSGDWVGAIGPVAVRLRPAAEGFWWQSAPDRYRWDAVARYFALDVDLGALQADWVRREPELADAVARWPGLRIMRQDAGEVFFAFACACCNTVGKVCRSVGALAERYGEPIAELDGRTVHAFPDSQRVAEVSEAALRADLWGFRAPRVIALAREACRRGPHWLDALRNAGYRAARDELAGLPGVGPKIADCICLFGLGFLEAVPVDTHIRQIAQRWLPADVAGGSLTRRRYDQVADAMRQRLGPAAGWAQQALFMRELAAGRGARRHDR